MTQHETGICSKIVGSADLCRCSGIVFLDGAITPDGHATKLTKQREKVKLVGDLNRSLDRCLFWPSLHHASEQSPGRGISSNRVAIHCAVRVSTNASTGSPPTLVSWRLHSCSYLLTLPAEWRFYRNQSSILRLTYVKRSASFRPFWILTV